MFTLFFLVLEAGGGGMVSIDQHVTVDQQAAAAAGAKRCENKRDTTYIVYIPF